MSFFTNLEYTSNKSISSRYAKFVYTTIHLNVTQIMLTDNALHVNSPRVPFNPVQFLLRKEKAMKDADENNWRYLLSFREHQKACKYIFDGLRKIQNKNRAMIVSGIL